MKLQPLEDRIVVRPNEAEETTVSGLVIPDTAKEKPQQGTVIAAGNGKTTDDGKRVPLDVKAGDRILFGKYAGQEITLDGEQYLIMKEDDVLAVIEGPAKQHWTVINGKTQKKTTTTKKSEAVMSKGTSMKKEQRKPKKKKR